MKKGIKRTLRNLLRNLEILILSLAVIMLWRGLWNLMDEYIVPHDFLLSNILSIIIGLFIIFLSNFDLEELHK